MDLFYKFVNFLRDENGPILKNNGSLRNLPPHPPKSTIITENLQFARYFSIFLAPFFFGVFAENSTFSDKKSGGTPNPQVKKVGGTPNPDEISRRPAGAARGGGRRENLIRVRGYPQFFDWWVRGTPTFFTEKSSFRRT